MAYYKVRIEVWCDWNPAEETSMTLPRLWEWVKRFVPCAKLLLS